MQESGSLYEPKIVAASLTVQDPTNAHFADVKVAVGIVRVLSGGRRRPRLYLQVQTELIDARLASVLEQTATVALPA